jgi:excisionase family DNA binding protein
MTTTAAKRMQQSNGDLPTDSLVVHKDQAARMAGLSLSSIDRAIATGELKTKKYGKRTLIMKSELQRFIESLPDQPPSRAKPRK